MKLISYIITAIGIIGFFVFCINTSVAVGISSLISGLILAAIIYTLGDISESLDEINFKLDLITGAKTNIERDSLPQKICPDCGDKHDFDYPKCPKCGHEYTA